MVFPAKQSAGEMGNKSLFWFRQDLRLFDNPALFDAVQAAPGKTLLVYIFAPQEEAPWQPSGASLVWLHHSLKALQSDLSEKGAKLHIFKTGTNERFQSSREVLEFLCSKLEIGSVFWNRRYEPAVIARDTNIKAALKEQGLEVETSNGALLNEPWQIKTKEGKPFQVFTPFWKACLSQMDLDPPLAIPDLKLANYGVLDGECSLDDLNLLPTIAWDKSIIEAYTPGEKKAQALLLEFLKKKVASYHHDRDLPHLVGVSRLSPYLHFGEISARTIWYQTKEFCQQNKKVAEEAAHFLRELGWREFSHHLLFHFPTTTDAPLRKDFLHFPWQSDDAFLKAWQKGQTGYPIVDAGMRELWQTGIMHNRVRMITASFLVKHLLQPWQEGAKWFWDTLVDADLAQNTLGWQWSAGCGADAAPYFRIFNPMLQGGKFDPDGLYVKQYVPELKNLPTKYIHAPWEAPPMVLASCGITLGETYPQPIVDHGKARERALAAFQSLKATSTRA